MFQRLLTIRAVDGTFHSNVMYDISEKVRD